jgi:hypothetical protein
MAFFNRQYFNGKIATQYVTIIKLVFNSFNVKLQIFKQCIRIIIKHIYHIQADKREKSPET